MGDEHHRYPEMFWFHIRWCDSRSLLRRGAIRAIVVAVAAFSLAGCGSNAPVTGSSSIGEYLLRGRTTVFIRDRTPAKGEIVIGLPVRAARGYFVDILGREITRDDFASYIRSSAAEHANSVVFDLSVGGDVRMSEVDDAIARLEMITFGSREFTGKLLINVVTNDLFFIRRKAGIADGEKH
jgi:hypothetical protein